MPSRSKKERKVERKRDRVKRAVAKDQRRLLRAAKEDSAESELSVDPAHDEHRLNAVVDRSTLDSFVTTSATPDPPKNPEIETWWELYDDAEGSQRLSMVRDKLTSGCDAQWQEALFPEAIFEAEGEADAADYVSLLEYVATDHRDVYNLGLQWFLRSRVNHYLAKGDHQKIHQLAKKDAEAMTKTDEPFYGTVAMLRLAGFDEAADALAIAGHRVMDDEQLMPWALSEISHFVIDIHVRECVAAGGTPDALAQMESELAKLNANMDGAVVEMRKEIISRLTGEKQTNWVRNQLLGTDQKSVRNRYLLSYEFARWLTDKHSIAPVAADELRGLWHETLSRGRLTMKNFLEGIPQPALDKQLALAMGFLSLDRFKAPATLIAVQYFVTFLAERGLAKDHSIRQSIGAISSLESQLRRLLECHWADFTFLDPLRHALDSK